MNNVHKNQLDSYEGGCMWASWGGGGGVDRIYFDQNAWKVPFPVIWDKHICMSNLDVINGHPLYRYMNQWIEKFHNGNFSTSTDFRKFN